MQGDAAEVLLGLGANLGDPVAQLREAVRQLSERIELRGVSSLYRSAPVGFRDQPDFFNVVCQGRTALQPAALLAATQEIERDLGRSRSFPNAPRHIDIDLLAWEDRVLDTPELTLPHPRLHRRAFVLLPLREIAPYWRHPVLGRSAAALLAEAGPLERIERCGSLGAWR